jgi:hypothetical protein
MPKPENVDKYGYLGGEKRLFNIPLRRRTTCGTRGYTGVYRNPMLSTHGPTYLQAGRPGSAQGRFTLKLTHL